MRPCLRGPQQWEQQLRGRAFAGWWRSLSVRKVVAHAEKKCRDPDSLLAIRGIGARTANILADKNITTKPELCKIFIQDYSRDANLFASYLGELGIRKRWATEIARNITEHDPKAAPAPIKPITFCVEGNIGAGKSTYLDMVKQSDMKRLDLSGRIGELREVVEIVPEPVHEWQDVDGANLLDVFYKDPQRYAYTFQSYVFTTRLLQEERSRAFSGMLRLLERSVFCDRMVFVKAVHEAHHLSELELKLYDSWFNPMLQMNPHLTPDGFVYLQTQPETCMRRLRHRNRSEEVGIQPPYLERLGEYHEEWLVNGGVKVHDLLSSTASRKLDNGRWLYQTSNKLFPSSRSLDGQRGTDGVTVRLRDPAESPTDASGIIIPQIPSLLEGNVVLLDSTRLHSGQRKSLDSLHMVPALHVDCNDDIDITDPDLMLQRAQTMAAYREWVGQYRAANAEFFQNKQVKMDLERHSMVHESLAKGVAGITGRGKLPGGSLELLSAVL